MKTLDVGAVLCLSACIGLIPSCKPKENADGPGPRADHEVIITLAIPPVTAPASGNQECVTIDSRLGRALVPIQDRGEITRIVRDTWIEYKSHGLAVIRMHDDELASSVTRIIETVVQGEMRKVRLEAGDIHTQILFPIMGQSGSTPHSVWEMESSEQPPVHSIYVLDADEAGWFAIWNDKFKGSESLTKALVAIKAAEGKHRPKVVITAEPKANWRNYVLACKAVTDAKIEYPGLSRKTQEHRYIREEDLPGRKRRRPRKREFPATPIPYEESPRGDLGIPPQDDVPETIIPDQTEPVD